MFVSPLSLCICIGWWWFSNGRYMCMPAQSAVRLLPTWRGRTWHSLCAAYSDLTDSRARRNRQDQAKNLRSNCCLPCCRCYGVINDNHHASSSSITTILLRIIHRYHHVHSNDWVQGVLLNDVSPGAISTYCFVLQISFLILLTTSDTYLRLKLIRCFTQLIHIKMM